MKTWAQKQKGFTIVELLIVIVVIAILAAISIVAYNGIQNRAENSKTIAAVSTWAKALQSYKAVENVYPTTSSCLGNISTYSDSFSGRCWAPETNTTWVVNQTFLTTMSNFLSSYPEPSNKNTHAATDQYRGALYYFISQGDARIYASFVGSVSVCPDISGLSTSFGNVARTNGLTCYYRLP